MQRRLPSRPLLATRPRAGLTLLELMLVMFLMAVIVGGGLGLFSALDLGKRQAASAVRNVIRSAQNTAIARQLPARVRIDAKTGEVRAEALWVIGTWHFENRRMEGYGPLGVASPELFVEDGYLGDALNFQGRIGEVAAIPVQTDPAFDLSQGFAIECAVSWAGGSGGRLLHVGEAVTLEVGPSGALRGRFRAAVQMEGRLRSGGEVVITSEHNMLAPRRWARVRLSYDRAALTLAVDGVPVATLEETAPVWELKGPLELSSRTRPFPGAVDELVISAVVADEPVVLPEGVSFVGDTPKELFFQAGGGLDRRRHPDPAVITLEFNDGSRTELVVGAYGTVQ